MVSLLYYDLYIQNDREERYAVVVRIVLQVVILETRDLHVAVGGKEVLKGVNLRIHEGEVHVLLGPNGCGKSTLLNTIMGLSQYTVLSGTIIYKGVDVTHMPIDERARRGLGLMHQKPPTVQGMMSMSRDST